MSVLKQSLLQRHLGISGDIVRPKSENQSAIGYFFDLSGQVPTNITPSSANGIAAVQGQVYPFILPVQQNLISSMFIDIDYSTVDGGNHWTADLRFCAAPCTPQNELQQTDGTEWDINTIFPNTTWTILGEDFQQKVQGTTGGNNAVLRYSAQTLVNNSASGTTSALGLYGTFTWGYYFENYAQTAVGDDFKINNIVLYLPFAAGIRI